jgi:hypothetical protein
MIVCVSLCIRLVIIHLLNTHAHVVILISAVYLKSFVSRADLKVLLYDFVRVTFITLTYSELCSLLLNCNNILSTRPRVG